MKNDYERMRLHELLIEELEDFAVFLIDLDGRIATWNPGVQRFFGYSDEEFIGRHIGEIFTPEDRAARAPERELQKASETGRASDIRWHLRKDQSLVFVEGMVLSIKDEKGDLAAFAKIARAVHPHHAAGSMLATLLEGTEDAIYAMDRDGRFVFANTKMRQLLDRSIEGLVGLTRDEVFSTAVAADMRATDESVLSSGHARVIEERVSTGQKERVFLTTKAPWRDNTGAAIGLVAIAKDITARNAYQIERERLLRDVRRSNEELSSFSHVVAHDLREPLRAVKLYAQLLAQHLRDKLDATALQFMAFVTDGADHMERLIDSLLRYAETGEELAPQRVNANAIVDGLLLRLQPLINESKAIVTRDPLPDVLADPVRLLQVFQNLMVNAVNYRGGEPPRIHISGESAGWEHRFAVADNGIGIAREHFESIFMPLKRLHATKDVPGIGIGLALCRKIVERHGGRMWVESHVGKGSTFFFTLPMRNE
jgi:PAS domain S-box-containing protein